jgi:hypothetical protein
LGLRAKKRFDPRPYAIGIVVIHLAINIAHGMAHAQLAIGLDAFQKLFVGVVILAAPLFAGCILWKGRLRTGGWLLAISMAGAFAFGVYFHFNHPGPDNVNQQNLSAPLRSRQLFEETATDLVHTDALGVGAGLALLLQSFTPEKKAAASNIGGGNSP